MLHLLPDSGLYRPDPKSNLYSIAIHAGAVLLLVAFASNAPIPIQLRQSIHLTDPLLAPLTAISRGGGGGGGRMLLPASQGKLPPRSPRTFVAPEAVLNNLNPKLIIQPTIEAPPDTGVPQVGVYGDPLSNLSIPSNGPGSGSGIGTGKNNGVGQSNGSGEGSSCCGGAGDLSGAFTSGVGGVSGPSVIFQVEPQYSDEARKAKLSGVVILELVVDPAGRARSIRVVSGTGMGLEEKAIEAVQQWRFRPGTRAGKAVPVRARVEVNFRLL